MKAIVCGGGTGGHIYPALAIAAALRERGWQLLFMGGADSLEQQMAAEHGFEFRGVTACGLHKRSPRLLGDLAKNYRGLRQARAIIADFAPDAAIGCGGYATAPVIYAAQQLHVPTVLHEQNAFPGLANRQLAKKAQLICLTFELAEHRLPHPERQYLTGLPVRQAILDADKQRALEYFRLPPEDANRLTLLITGGSQGAENLNRAALAAYTPLLEAGLRIIHICGRDKDFVLRQQAPVHPQLIILPYLEQMEHVLALADLAVARAGASFLSEAACLGLPTLLVPYPYAANDHQTHNARAFTAVGAARLIADKDLTGRVLAEQVLTLTRKPELLHQMSAAAQGLARCNAAGEIVDLINQLVISKK